MKKLFITWGFVAAALTLFSCAKQEVINDTPEQPAVSAGVLFELTAGVDTKTEATDAGVITWKTGDALNVFHAVAGSKTYGSNDQFTFSSGSSFTGTLQDGELTADAYDWYALYPYYSGIKTPANTSAGYTTFRNSQTQTGNSSMAHLCGSGMPLYGKATNVAKDAKLSVEMKQAASIIKVHVTNKLDAALTVASVSVTAPVNIAGNYFINFAGDTPSFTESSSSGKKTVTLTVSGGDPIAKDGWADFYIAVMPFSVSSGKITVAVNGEEKDKTISSETEFAAGKIKTINYDYDSVETVATLPFSIDGTAGASAYSTEDGLSASGLGSDYADSNSPYLTKFDSTGDFIQIHYDVPAGKVSFGVKMIGGGNTSSMKLSGSADGSSFTDIETFSISGSSGDVKSFTSSNAIADSYRYLRLTFTKGSNVGFGPLSISVASTAPVISALNINDVLAAGVVDEDWTYSVNNFTDDVEVAEFTGCVSDAVVAAPGAILYSVAPNYKTTAENGTIVLWSASNHAVTKTINVAQLKSSLSVSPLTVTIPASDNTATFTVTSPDFGYDAVVASVEDGMNLTISSGASGSANADAQTVTVSSTSAAPTSGDAAVLGTIDVYRNANASDPQKISITIKKASTSGGAPKTYTGTFAKISDATSYLTLTEPGSTSISSTITVTGGALGQNVDGTKGAQVGTGSNACTSIVISVPFTGSVSSITLNTSGAKSVNASLSMSVGGTAYKSGGNSSVNLTNSATDYTFTGSASGTVTITITNSSSKAIYLKNISITGVK